MSQFRCMCMYRYIVPNLFVEHVLFEVHQPTEERATSFGLLPWCSFVQLPWTQGVGWCDLNCPWLCSQVIVPLRWRDMSAVCKAATSSDADKARERFIENSNRRLQQEVSSIRHWRSSGRSSLAPLLNRLCWPSHFVPAMKWSRRKPVSSWLNLKVAIPDSRGSCETAWSCWICCWKTETCWAWRARRSSQLYRCFYSERTSPTSFLAYIDSPRSLKTKIQKFSLEWIIKHILEI